MVCTTFVRLNQKETHVITHTRTHKHTHTSLKTAWSLGLGEGSSSFWNLDLLRASFLNVTLSWSQCNIETMGRLFRTESLGNLSQVIFQVVEPVESSWFTKVWMVQGEIYEKYLKVLIGIWYLVVLEFLSTKLLINITFCPIIFLEHYLSGVW